MEPTVKGLDPTLPLDLNGSTNLQDLPEVTFDGSMGDRPPSRAASASPGLVPMVAKTGSGRMSPVRGRTIKEYDQQIAELKKENFSLKLRIYFLEERMEQKFGTTEDTFKTNIELKVAVQSLKQELADKQELLRKASQAMEALTSGQQSDMDSLRQNLEAQHKKYTEDLKQDLEQAIVEAERSREEAENANKRMRELEFQLCNLESQMQQELFKSKKLEDAALLKEREMADLQGELEERGSALASIKVALKQAEEERQAAHTRAEQAEKLVQRKDRDVEQLSSALKDQSMVDGHSFLASRHLEDQVQDQQEKLDQLQTKVSALEETLSNRDMKIDELEKEVQERDKSLKEAGSKVEQLAQEMEQELEYSRRRDLTIQGLVNEVHKKEKELSRVKEKLAKSAAQVKTLRVELHEAEMAKHQDGQEGLDVDALERLQQQLTEASAKNEEMIRSLGKKEGELAGFREQLDCANQALKRSEEALESLQEQLEKERGDAKGKLDLQIQQYQKLLDEHNRQLEGKDCLMAQMTQQLRAKDKQLASVMDLLTDDSAKNQKELFKRLVNDLDKSASTLRNDLERKREELEEAEQKLEDARQNLRDKGNELRQAMVKLQHCQDEMERLQHKNTELEETIGHLAASVSKAQNALEDSIDKNSNALKEKEKVIQRLQAALKQRDDTIKQLSMPDHSHDEPRQHIHQMILEKDRLIEDLRTDQIQAAVKHEEALHSLKCHLQDKEEEIEALNSKQRKEVLNYDREIKQLMAQLAEKEAQVAELQAGARVAEEHEKEALKRLQRMLHEKDKTIEALMDSMEEKERLLQQSQQNLTEDAKAQLAEVESLQAENRHLRQCLNENSEYRGGENHGHGERKESMYSSHHEKVIHTYHSYMESDSKEVVMLLKEQLKEMQKLGSLLQDHTSVLTNLKEQCSRKDAGPHGSASVIRSELSASRMLHQHLHETIERSQQLHCSLLGYTVRQTDNPTLGESTSLDGLQATDSASCTSSISSLSIATSANDQFQTGAHPIGKTQFDSSRVQDSVSLGTQTSPSWVQVQNHLGVGAVSSLSFPQQHCCCERCPSSSVDVLQRAQESGSGNSPPLSSLSSEQLAGMSAAILRDLVSQLQEDLIAAAQSNAALAKQLKAFQHGTPHIGDGSTNGENNRGVNGTLETVFVDTLPSELQSQVESLKKELNLKEKETAALLQHLGLTRSESGSAVDAMGPVQVSELRAEIRSLHGHVKEMNKINDLLQQQISNSKGLDNAPQLVVSMSYKIDCLHEQIKSLFTLANVKSPQNGPDSASNGQENSGSPVSFDHLHSVSAEAALQEALGSQISSAEGDYMRYANMNQNEARERLQCADGAAENPSHEMDQIPCLMGPGPNRAKKEKTRIPVTRVTKLKLLMKEPVPVGEVVTLTRKLQEAEERIKYLENQLAATESTVRFTRQRLRQLQSQVHCMKGNGARELPLTRSQSETCLLLESFGTQLSPSQENLKQPRESTDRPGEGTASSSKSDGGTAAQGLHSQRTWKESEHQGKRLSEMAMPGAALSMQQEPHSVSPSDEADGGYSSGSHHQNFGDSEASTAYHADGQGTDNNTEFHAEPFAEMTDYNHIPRQTPSTHRFLQQLVQSDQTCVTLSSICEGERDFSMLPGDLTYSSFSENITHLGPSDHAQDSAVGVSHVKLPKQNQVRKNSCLTKSKAFTGHPSPKSQTEDDIASVSNEFQLPADADVSALQAKVQFLSDMNMSLRDELQVYDQLCQSMGVQVSFSGSITGVPVTSKKETNSNVDILLQHLVEIRRLRAILEQLDSDAYEDMQSSLLRQMQRVQELEGALQKLKEELQQKEGVMSQKNKTITEHKNLIVKLQTSISQQEIFMKERELEIKRNQEEGEQYKGKILALEESNAQKDEEHKIVLEETQRALQESENKRKKMQDQLAAGQQQLKAVAGQLLVAKQHNQHVELQLKAAQQKCEDTEGCLQDSRHESEQLRQELKKLKDETQAAERTVQELQQREVELEEGLCKLRCEKEELEKRVARTTMQEIEMKKLRQRADQLEKYMREHQQKAAQNEQQLKDAQVSLQKCQAREQEAQGTLKEVQWQVTQLEIKLKDAEDRASASQKVAEHAGSLVRTLEGRVRDLEAQVQEAEETSKTTRQGASSAQAVVNEQRGVIEKLQKEIEQQDAKLRKRYSQLKRLVPEYERVQAALNEMTAINQTLRCEVQVYQDMQSQADEGSDQKELMKQLLQELSRTRRLVENIISRHRQKENISPVSTNGDTADGKCNPQEPLGIVSQGFETQQDFLSLSHASSHSDFSDGSASHRFRDLGSLSSSQEHSTDSPSGQKAVLTRKPSAGSPRALSDVEHLPAQGVSPKLFIERKPLDADGSPQYELVPAVSPNSRVVLKDSSQKNTDRELVVGLSPRKNLKYWQGTNFSSFIPQVNVDSDLRHLFAVGDLEGYEKLKRENGELLCLLSAMQARLNHRLKTFSTITMSEIMKSMEYSTLRELHVSAQNMRVCAEEEGRLIASFWITQLPPVNAAGEFYDPKLTEENENLKLELQRQKQHFDVLVHTVNEHRERLHATNAMRKKWEATLYKQYEHFRHYRAASPIYNAAISSPSELPSYLLSPSNSVAGPGKRSSVVASSPISPMSKTAETLEEAEENFDSAGLVPEKHSPTKWQSGSKHKKSLI